MNIKDLAAQLGLSASTVSKAINDRADVSLRTRARVLEFVARSKYTADPSARRLRQQTSETIGFVLSAPQTRFAHPFFLDMLLGIEEGLSESQLQIIVMSSRSVEQEIEVFEKLVEHIRVDALLFSRTRVNDQRIEYLLDRGIPFVTFGRSSIARPFPFLDIDHTTVGRVGCERFISLGHKRIALLNTPSYLMISQHHRVGYQSALKAAGLPFLPELVVEGDISEEGGAYAMKQLLALDDPPTAIVCGQDLMAIGAMRAISEHGLKPGLDIGVIGGDNHPVGKIITPALTTFSADTYAAGRRMVELLCASLAGTDVHELQEIWTPTMILRSSDGAHR